MLRIALLLAFAGALVGAKVAPARAGACPPDGLVVLPGDDHAGASTATAPINVELRAVFAAPDVEVVQLADPTTRAIAASGPANASDASLVLRTAGGRDVPLVLRRALSAPHPVLLARPAQELAPSTAYVVSVATRDREYVVAHFTTTAERDTDAPALARITGAQVYRWPAVRDWKDPSGMYAEVALSGVQGAAGIELHELADGEAPSETSLRWVGGPSRVRLGVTSSCGRASYELLAKGRRRVWLRAFDLAGNASALREVTLDTTRPRRAR